MKKIIYSFIISALLVTAAGCADLLDTHSPDQLTQDKFYRDQTDDLKALAAAYSRVDGAEYWDYAEVKFTVEEFRTDLVETGTDTSTYPDWQSLFDFTNNDSNTQTAYYWNSLYFGILTANQAYFGTQKTPDDDKKIDSTVRQYIVNEARFLRAFYHFYLQMNWRQIIVRDALPTASTTSKALSSRSDSWDFIISELNACAPLMAISHDASAIGRATQSTAYAYLGWALVNRAYEDADGNFVTTPDAQMLRDALAALEKVNGSLEPNFVSMFDGSNKNSAEGIFERQFSLNTDGGFWLTTIHHNWLKHKALGGWDEIRPSQAALDYFTAETNGAGDYDRRAYASLLFSCPYYNDADNFPYADDTFDNVFASETRLPKAAFRKYLPSTASELSSFDLAMNVPLMRYSNVMLLRAEIYAKLGENEDTAWELINEIRDVHGNMPAVSAADKTLMEAIEHERIMEFAMENSRFFDLRRWSQTEKLNKYDGTGSPTRLFTSKNLYFPIPNAEVLANEKLHNTSESAE